MTAGFQFAHIHPSENNSVLLEFATRKMKQSPARQLCFTTRCHVRQSAAPRRAHDYGSCEAKDELRRQTEQLSQQSKVPAV